MSDNHPGLERGLCMWLPSMETRRLGHSIGWPGELLSGAGERGRWRLEPYAPLSAAT